MDRYLAATFQVEQHHFWFRGFRRFVRPLLIKATKGVERPRLLDCGCGTGANLEMLGEFGRAYGFDLTWSGLQFARRAGWSGLVRADIARAPFRDDTFDVVTSFDVLVCVGDEDEVPAIAEMYRVLRPGGAAIINVAAMEILRGNVSLLSHELRRYTRTRLRALLARAGFRIVHLTHTNATLFPVMLAVRLVQRRARAITSDGAAWDLAVPPRPINAIFSAALALEAPIVSRVNLPFGSSLLCLARKTG